MSKESDRVLLMDGFGKHLGLTLTEASGDEVLGRIVVTPELHQPFGVVHGGVYSSVVETVASVGAALWFGDRGNVVGVANHTNFLRAVREGELGVRATPIQRGRTQQLWTVDITDERDRLIAKGEVRLANLTPAGSAAQSPPDA
jgi:1,4-dihydroxy-2-naphthoyl-CoA hydrolase